MFYYKPIHWNQHIICGSCCFQQIYTAIAAFPPSLLLAQGKRTDIKPHEWDKFGYFGKAGSVLRGSVACHIRYIRWKMQP